MTKETLAKQAIKACINILKVQKHFGHFHYKDAFKLFDAMVVPIICYSSEIWGYQYSKVIEKVQVYFCKRICLLNRNVPDALALSECGRYPLSVVYMTRCIKYWIKLTRMPNHRYPGQCYSMLRRFDDAGKKTWTSYIRLLLFENGFGYVWLSNEVGDELNFINIFKQRLKDCAIQKLRTQIETSPKSLHYRHFKSALNPERYLSMNIAYSYKKALSNFRCSGHCLMIEKGRHVNIDRDYRFCPLCLRQNIYSVEI